jgi:lipoate-protein ligase A
VLPIEFLVQENLESASSLATDRYFLNGFQKPARARVGVLRVYTARGEAVSAGRYHPLIAGTGPVAVWRRLSGGRTVPFGDGFVGFSLLLPHRSALVSPEPFHLAPYQVPNRCVRGLLAALRALGLDAFYPGRDLVTVNRRTLAMVSFETDERGALLFEGVLAVERDFAVLSDRLARGGIEDPIGSLGFDDRAVTCLVRETGRRFTAREIAECLQRGYAEQFGVDVVERSLSPLEGQAIEAIAAREFHAHWVSGRLPGPELDRSATSPIALGIFEVRFAVEQERFLREVRFLGDFIANSAGIEELERSLKLCPLDWEAIALVVDQVYNRPENYLLGIGRLRTIPDTLLNGIERRATTG